jgi:hypothetical protein
VGCQTRCASEKSAICRHDPQADGDHVECSVGLSVAAGVEPVAVGAAGACLDRGGAAELGEGFFAAEAVDVLAGGNEELACALGADSEELAGAGGGGAHELLELAVEFEDLAVEFVEAAGEVADPELCGLCRLMEALHVGRSFRQRVAFALMVRPWRSSLRSCSGAVMIRSSSCCRAAWRASSALVLTTCSCRIASTIPLVLFGDSGRSLAGCRAGGKLGVDRVALAGRNHLKCFQIRRRTAIAL